MADNNDKADAEERDYKADKAIEEVLEEKPVDESVSPPVPPEMLFQRHDFRNIPGVSLIVPDGTAPADLIRIAGQVQIEVGLMVMRRVTNALTETLLG